jgi:hypothetical protein
VASNSASDPSDHGAGVRLGPGTGVPLQPTTGGFHREQSAGGIITSVGVALHVLDSSGRNCMPVADAAEPVRCEVANVRVASSESSDRGRMENPGNRRTPGVGGGRAEVVDRQPMRFATAALSSNTSCE